MKTAFHIFFLSIIISVLYSCEVDEKRMTDFEDYSGPTQIIYGAVILHSDSGVVKAKIEAEEILEFDNGNKDLPLGVYLEFFNSSGQTTGTLKADHAVYTKEDELWRAWGNVILNNIANGERLNTEELFWDPKNEKVFTENFVQISTKDQVLLGEGLMADQDFSSWQITKPTGELTIEE